MDKDSIQVLNKAIEHAKVKLEHKNRRFEKLRHKLEQKISQDKVMKSLLISKNMAKLFGEIVDLVDQIGAFEEERKALQEND